MKLIFITGNKGKFEEAKAIIPDLEQMDVDLVEIQSIDSKEVINHKLIEARNSVTDDFVVEDNSLYIEALNGLPGPLIKWFLKTIGNDGLFKLATSYNNCDALARVVVGLSKSDGSINFFEGEIRGKIVSPRGENGFGWDPIFEIEGTGKTFAEMTAEEKNKISMRKIAFQKLKEYLEI